MFWTRLPAIKSFKPWSSLRIRLCTVIVAMMAILIGFYGMVAYRELSNDLMAIAREGLEAQVLPLLHSSGIDETQSLEDFSAKGVLLVSALKSHHLNSSIYNEEGRLLISSNNTAPYILPPENRPVSKASFTENQQPKNPILVYTVQVGRDTRGYVRAEASLQHVQDSLVREQMWLVGGGALALVAAFILAYLLVGFILKPLTGLSRTAREVAGNNLEARAPVYAGPDELSHLITVFNDMLDHLQEAFIQQEKAYNYTRKYMADASHEFRSPLTVINGYIDILHRGAVKEEDERERIFATIRREMARLIRLGDNLLTLARIESGLPLVKQKVDAAELIHEAAARVQLLDPARQLYVETEGECIIYAEPERFRQLLNNLVDNAIYHGGFEARIYLGCKKEPGQVVIWVRDTGKGIAEQELPHIFERFWRSPSTLGITRGTGLGLSIVRAIADSLGGSIEVVSQPGQGSIFTVKLPAQEKQGP